MPSARSSAAPRRAPAARRGRASSRGVRAASSPWARVRWDRVGRTSLLIVLAVVAGLYLQHAIEYLTTRSEAHRQQARVQQLARANAQLRAQQKSLSDPTTIKRDARALGMVQSGERSYAVVGLPKH
jgi:cell division protein FtsB